MPPPSPLTPASSLRQRIEAAAFRFAEILIPRIPRPLYLLLIRLIAPIAQLLDHRGRAVAHANLQAALGPLPPAALHPLLRQTYRSLARSFLDFLRTPLLTSANWRQHIAHQDLADLDSLAAQGRGIIFVCLHSGPFEWNNLLLAFLGHPPLVVTQGAKNPAIAARLARLRSRAGSELIPQDRSFLRMFKHLRRGGPVGLLADLTLSPKEPSVIIQTFGGLQMCVNRLAAELHLRTGAPIVPLTCQPLSDGRASITIHHPLPIPPHPTALSITQALWDHSEPHIRQRPDLWLWTYKHWRYLPEPPASPPARPHPFYANPSQPFTRLLLSQQSPSLSPL